MADRATFKVGGALVQIDKKFTRKEGKPFAVVWIEDLTGTLEVVIWNDVYTPVSDALATGRVILIQGTVDMRGDSLRATAQKVKVLTGAKINGAAANERSTSPLAEQSAVLLQFAPTTTSDDLREVLQILATSPGQRRVRLCFDRTTIEAAADFSVDLTRELEEKLSRWLITSKSERRDVAVDSTVA